MIFSTTFIFSLYIHLHMYNEVVLQSVYYSDVVRAVRLIGIVNFVDLFCDVLDTYR